MAIHQSDVASIPDQPITAGAVLIVPDHAVPSFWAAVGLPPSGPPALGKSEFLVAPSAVPSGAEVAPIADGRFTSAVPGGPVLLCLADALAGDEQGPPYRVSGCARHDGPVEVRLSIGIGGVRATPA